mgnify:CR=1 FL=1|jgi:hypothetical protein
MQLHSSEPDVFTEAKSRKITDIEKMIETYVDNLRSKGRLNQRDKKLLQVVGLEDVIDILKERDEYFLEMNLGQHKRTQLQMNMDFTQGGALNASDLNEIIDLTSTGNHLFNRTIEPPPNVRIKTRNH